MTKWMIFAMSVACTVAALFVPWSYWGDIEFGLFDHPIWFAPLAQVVLMYASTFWHWGVSSVFGALALVGVGIFVSQYGNSQVFFPDGIVPAVHARLGLGGLLLIAGLLINGVLLVMTRALPAKRFTAQLR